MASGSSVQFSQGGWQPEMASKLESFRLMPLVWSSLGEGFTWDNRRTRATGTEN